MTKILKNNKELINDLIKSSVLRSDPIIEAFLKIDRKDFVNENYIEFAYIDRPLPIGLDQTISQPYTVAFMLELLNVQLGNKVLDVGSGSGWTTALLRQIVGESGNVLGLERFSKLVSFGRKNVKKYFTDGVKIEISSKGFIGKPEQKFDRILVSAASSTTIPQELISQLKVGGVMVIPVKNSIYRLQKKESRNLVKEYKGFSFVPLVV